jgi:hypothetical protein
MCDDHYLHIMIGCVHERKHIMWLAVDVIDRCGQYRLRVYDAIRLYQTSYLKHNVASSLTILMDLLCLQVTQMSIDLDIW